jgi:hypothetical protein
MVGVFATAICGQNAQAQGAPQRSYIVCTIHEVSGTPDRKQAFVIDDKMKIVNGVSGSAIGTFTAEKIIWRDESFETTLDRVAGFITIHTLASGDIFSSGPCVRTEGPQF